MTTPNTTEEEKRMKKQAPTEWEQGYICAASNIIRTHGDTVIAKDVLLAIVPDLIDWKKANPEDTRILRRAGVIK